MSIYDIAAGNRSVIDVGNTIQVDERSSVDRLFDLSTSDWYITDANVDRLEFFPYTRGNIPFVRDWYIDSDSTASLTWDAVLPGRVAGDLMVAAIMTRSAGGVLTAPAGWDYQGVYLQNLSTGTSGIQQITVFTRKSIGAGTPNATWTQENSEAICGLVATVGNGTILNSNVVYGQGNSVSIDNAGADFYLTIASWVDTNSTTPQTYGQSGIAIGKITDSPQLSARISGSYSSFATTVTSNYTLPGSDGDHGIVTLGFKTADADSGEGNIPSDRPESGFLYPRRLY